MQVPTNSLRRNLLLVIFMVMTFSLSSCREEPHIEVVDFKEQEFADFVETDFPFVSTSIDARELGSNFPDDNLVPRCLAMRLGTESYACFDTDMLRWSVAWTGDFLPMVTMAQISYDDFSNKDNLIPGIAGEPQIATGLYPGWNGAEPDFSDPRPPAPHREDLAWGPIPEEIGRWNGVYLAGDEVVLSYSVESAEVFEKPGAIEVDGGTAFTRTIQAENLQETLSMVAAEVPESGRSEVEGNTAYLFHGAEEDSVTAIGLAEADPGVELAISDDRYAFVRISPDSESARFTVVLWKGSADQSDRFEEMLSGADTSMPDFREGNAGRWQETVKTRGKVSPDTSAYVTDQLTLPIPNPWQRNVRAVDIDFFSDHSAAVVTFEGDVWLVDGIDDDLRSLSWTRYASGLYEPQSIEVVDDEVYVFGREGIVRLNDLNDDGEADFYENFSNLMAQSIETREWPSDLAEDPDGGFYVAKFGPLDMGPEASSPQVVAGFRAGSQHGGSILKVSADGRDMAQYATGFRGPYIGIHPETGQVSASDQQGHFVPSTPIMLVNEGDYFGVPATAHRDPVPEEGDPPLTWIPHNVDRSATGQVWATSDNMGPLSGEMIHLSYGRPGMFHVLMDSTENGIQGGVVPIPAHYPGPTMKGAVNPRDGLVYAAGFSIWQSNATELSAVVRLRYTGEQSLLPDDFSAGEEGIVLHFDTELDEETATDAANYRLKRWNYQRSEEYGSGHFNLDGSPGEEQLPVYSAHLSDDHKSLYLAVPNIEEVMQMELSYQIESADGSPMDGDFWFTVNEVNTMDLMAEGFGDLDREELLASAEDWEPGEEGEEEISAERGEQLFQRTGCLGCHAIDASSQDKIGPTMYNLYGSEQNFEDGSSTEADEAYLRESLLDPNEKIVEGYDEGMPSFRGVLSEAEIESVILYIESLSDEDR